MHSVSFKQVDVFTHEPFNGNPVAVVLDAQGLTTEQMQKIANWTNLSETTFVLPAQAPQADYRVRIFTPKSELPFAGHPTIGTAYALLEAERIHARQGKVIQECAAGLIELTVIESERGIESECGIESIAFNLPKEKASPLTEPQILELEIILGVKFSGNQRPKIMDVGPRWIVGQLENKSGVLSTQPNFSQLADFEERHQVTGVCIFSLDQGHPNTQVEVRSFAPSCGVNEDPVCGSGNGAVAAFIRQAKDFEAMPLRSAQGHMVGRDGRISLVIEPDRIQVGGAAVTCIEGVIKLPC